MGPQGFPMADTRKINLRIPEELLHMASSQAARMGISANAYVLMAIRNFIPFQEQQLQRQAAALSRASRPTADSGTFDAMPKIRGARPMVEAPVPKVGANQACPCGSGEKYKRCHGRR